MDKTLLLMATARLWAEASYAERNKVGCVIAKEGRILSTGYNGTLPGRDNCCESNGQTIDEVMHAEQNALMFCVKNGVATKDCDVYVTLSPCMACAKMLVMAGIKRVFYGERYRDMEPIALLESFNVAVEFCDIGDI